MSDNLYYEVHCLSSGKQLTFTTRQAAEKFVESCLCKDCAQSLENGGYADYDPSSKSYECAVIKNPLDTDCGAEYRITPVTHNDYMQRANQALDEIASLWRSEYDAPPVNEGAD